MPTVKQFFSNIPKLVKLLFGPQEDVDDALAKSAIDLIGYRSCDKKGILLTSQGTYARFLRVATTDLFAIDRDGMLDWIDGFTLSERVYTDTHKLIAVTARVETSDIQQHWQHLRGKVGNSKSERYRWQLINEELALAEAVQKNPKDYVERIFAIEIYAKTKKQLEQKTRSMIISNGGYYRMSPMDKAETEELLDRLFNMNSK